MKSILTTLLLIAMSFAAFTQEVTIGTQIWKAQNEQGIGYCYGNNGANCLTMGGLFTWQQAMNGDTTEGAQGICPDGWHIPTLDEAQTLMVTLGGMETSAPKLKKVGKWEFARATCTPQPTNSSGFSAVPSGTRWSTGTYVGNTVTAMWWTSTNVDGTSPGYEAAYYFGVRYCSSDIKQGQLYINPSIAQAISVRCIKD
mgnify:CR=1 FL=1